ncbi:hypothetical protein VB780_07780 [Leptolyngbya sp. CCNP1308]|uniref:hypothetical protein n=1 Tax=Leptolyngbya sp. CCNP1308 TaxID=3110255 RepID=UPI002B20C7C9|nr:hypothetical protein [Leptolyngbya sp. CCNP1308]MEA5448461.1 hypothetical protein [Leptolyngbya sp. CCNP1308]
MKLNTELLSAKYRHASVDLENKRLLITNFHNTEQEEDLTEPPNCNGFGRVRHFRRHGTSNWPDNPLPIDPACKALGLKPLDMLRAQVFQNAACNWRCWYCYVPFNLLAADQRYSKWISPSELINSYLEQANPPSVIDLTGGQPDLIPEWVPWTMAVLKERDLAEKVYLWSDDNLSNDYFWRFLSNADIELIATYPNYGRVCCFKGFDAQSFAFNTRAEPELFDQQFELMKRLLGLKIDLYAYVTFTSISDNNLESKVRRFIDRLQDLNENLPLRTIPLEIQAFTPTQGRLDKTIEQDAIRYQNLAIEVWKSELDIRYTSEQRSLSIADILLYHKN